MFLNPPLPPILDVTLLTSTGVTSWANRAETPSTCSISWSKESMGSHRSGWISAKLGLAIVNSDALLVSWMCRCKDGWIASNQRRTIMDSAIGANIWWLILRIVFKVPSIHQIASSYLYVAHFSHPLIYPFHDGLEGPIWTETGDCCKNIVKGHLHLGIWHSSSWILTFCCPIFMVASLKKWNLVWFLAAKIG